MAWTEAVTTILHHALLLLAVVNPVGNIPIFADLTARMQARQRGRVMNLAVFTALTIVIAFALIGNWLLLYLFSVTVTELRIAGGILLFIVAINGVMPRQRASSRVDDPKMVAIFPIAFPLLVGPGAITMTIIMAQSIGHILMTLTAAATFVLVFVIVRNSNRLAALLGPYVGRVVARLLYVLLAAKAVSLVLSGIEEFYKHLQSP
ncbi:MAG TPA: MarC family protein [Anaerohalosphaeraceae bacterium]|jgi:multiple antibiotic resistance protein|nr:MarC family protein [Anaerohalosphaeraceae bacterium]HRT49923.1 MarC family protein [Anaerohalosphaeraceae bacterium]HRT85779.1 MarC family protein [Anaerohalosphaeraceae bacterium]